MEHGRGGATYLERTALSSELLTELIDATDRPTHHTSLSASANHLLRLAFHLGRAKCLYSVIRSLAIDSVYKPRPGSRKKCIEMQVHWHALLVCWGELKGNHFR